MVRHLWQAISRWCRRTPPTPRARCRNGRRDRGWRCRSTSRLPVPGPITRRSSPPRCASPGCGPRAGGRLQAPRSKRRRARAARARRRARGARRWLMTRQTGAAERGRGDRAAPLRLRRDPRRAELGQVDAPQRARRRQSLDRFAQGADDAHARSAASPRGDSQLIFIDTPGIFRPRRRLDRAMVERPGARPRMATLSRSWWTPRAARRGLRAILERLKRASTRRIAILNKVDRIPGRSRERLLARPSSARRCRSSGSS